MSPSPSARSRDHLHPTSAPLAHSASTALPYTGSTALPRRWRPFKKNPSGAAPIRTRATFGKTPSAHSRAHLHSPITARACAPRFACICRAQQAHIHTPTTRVRAPPTVHHRLPGSPIPIATLRTRARCLSDLARIRAPTQQPRLHRHRPRSPPPVLVPTPTPRSIRRRPRPWYPRLSPTTQTYT
jgi:hypothetical protein